MRKKVVLCLLLGCLAVGVFGCAKSEEAGKISANSASEERMTKEEEKEAEREKEREERRKRQAGEEAEEEKDKDEEKENEEKQEKNKDKEEEKEKVEKEETEKEDKKVSKKSASDAPVVGEEDIEDYDGFEYLNGEILMTDTEENSITGEKERKKLTVFIPEDDYANVSGSRAYASTMGVMINVELEPYVRYNAEDYLLSENLDYYVELSYDPFYTTSYKDLEISDAEMISDNACMATVEYCLYSNWDDSYSTIFTTYYLAELSDDRTILVQVEVNEDGVSGKTPRLLEELETFYEFEIDWDEERAEEKREAYIASGGDHKFSTGYAIFELPDDWKEVTDGVDYEENIYAPGGDVDKAGCLINFRREYLDYGEEIDIEAFAQNEDAVQDILEESLSMHVQEFEMEMCETCFGETVKITYSMEDDFVSGKGECYLAADDYNIYLVQAIVTEDAVEDPFIVLDGILNNAQVKEW